MTYATVLSDLLTVIVASLEKRRRPWYWAGWLYWFLCVDPRLWKFGYNPPMARTDIDQPSKIARCCECGYEETVKVCKCCGGQDFSRGSNRCLSGPNEY